MARVRVLVLRAAGINCDEETAHAWAMAGAGADRVHVRRLIETPALLDAYQVLTVPGGFSYGDDIASGKVLACQLAHHLGDVLDAFVDRGGLVLGICNGFQVLVRLGLLPGRDCDVGVTLSLNDSGHYEARWVRVGVSSSHCIFLEAGETLHLPVAHAEGKIVAEGDESGVAVLAERGRIALRYLARDGGPPKYPENPNGSIENLAALTDATGRVLGLMPHPERNTLPTHPPCGNGDSNTAGHGCRLFQRAVKHLS
ncbi:MAG: phosphoribosylformylglycinamidine synthase subunit PurQ [Planctomycetota bacterium]